MLDSGVELDSPTIIAVSRCWPARRERSDIGGRDKRGKSVEVDCGSGFVRHELDQVTGALHDRNRMQPGRVDECFGDELTLDEEVTNHGGDVGQPTTATGEPDEIKHRRGRRRHSDSPGRDVLQFTQLLAGIGPLDELDPTRTDLTIAKPSRCDDLQDHRRLMRRTMHRRSRQEPDVVRVAKVMHHLIDEMNRWWRASGTVFGRDRYPSAFGHRNELARFPSPLQTVRHDVDVDGEQLRHLARLDVVAAAAHQPISQPARGNRRRSHRSSVSNTGMVPVFDTAKRRGGVADVEQSDRKGH